MNKESGSVKGVRYIAAVIGIVAIFLPWSRAEASDTWFSLDYQATLWKIVLLSPGYLAVMGAVLFIVGSIVLLYHSAGLIAQAAGILLLALTVLDYGAIGFMGFEDVTMTLGIGLFVGVASLVVAVAGLMYRWAWAEGAPGA